MPRKRWGMLRFLGGDESVEGFFKMTFGVSCMQERPATALLVGEPTLLQLLEYRIDSCWRHLLVP